MPVNTLILASGSPRRRQLLEQIGLPLEVIPSKAEEPPFTGGSALDYCALNARLKAEEVAERHPERFVLGADTVVILDGVALGKPRDRAHGARMLALLSGRDHVVATAFALIGPKGRQHVQIVETEVSVKILTPHEILGYLDTGEPDDKAGAYGIQGIGTFLVESIKGSYSNVVGLPVVEVLEALEALGGPRHFEVRGS